MAIDEKDIVFYLSGGSGNTDPNASLGGVRSTTRIKSKTFNQPTNITGVTILDISAQSSNGSGALNYYSSSTTLKWTDPGGSQGSAVDVSSDGTYIIRDSDTTKFVIVSVTSASLPGSDQLDTITITDPDNLLWDNIYKTENYYGDTEYRAIYIRNENEEETGTATGGSSNTLVDTSKSWASDEWGGYYIMITGSTGAGQIREIQSNTSDTITVASNWNINPASGSQYVIFDNLLGTRIELDTEPLGELETGTATGGGSNTIQDAGKSWTTDEWANKYIAILSGSGIREVRQIISNTDTTITVDENWETQPTSGSAYKIMDNTIEFGYEETKVNDEVIATGDGSQVTFSGTLNNAPILERYLQITDDTETFFDDGAGNLTGDKGGNGTINYTTGAYSVTFNSAPAYGQSIKADYVKYLQSVSSESTAPSGVKFYYAKDPNGLLLGVETWGELRYQEHKGVWLRRRVWRATSRSPQIVKIEITGT